MGHKAHVFQRVGFLGEFWRERLPHDWRGRLPDMEALSPEARP